MEQPWEHSLLERKLESYKDSQFLATFVAFANSVPPDETALVLIGETDEGSVVGVTNPDATQKRVRGIFDKIYPTPAWKQILYEDAGKTCIRVEIQRSGDTPHFGGAAWVRRGSETIKATGEVLQRLIDLRSGKVSLLSQWLGKPVTVVFDEGSTGFANPNAVNFTMALSAFRESRLVHVNAHWITVKNIQAQERSFPIEKIRIGYDNSNLRIELWVLWSG